MPNAIVAHTTYNNIHFSVIIITIEHGIIYLLLSAPLPHTTPSKKTLKLTYLDYPTYCDNCVF